MYKIANIAQTCFACPSQWEGRTEDGKDVYIRFRWGILRLDIDGETIVSIEAGKDELDGIISLETALVHLKDYLMMTPEAMKEYYNS